MHNAALAALGLNWRYLACDVPPENLRSALAGAGALRFIGLNLTVPHKLLAFEMVDANKVMWSSRADGTIPENAWTHLAVVVERASRKTSYYLNGALDSARDLPATFTGALDVAGGDLSLGSNWQPFIGLLDEVRILQRALNPAEIKASYEQEKGTRASAAYNVVE